MCSMAESVAGSNSIGSKLKSEVFHIRYSLLGVSLIDDLSVLVIELGQLGSSDFTLANV